MVAPHVVEALEFIARTELRGVPKRVCIQRAAKRFGLEPAVLREQLRRVG